MNKKDFALNTIQLIAFVAVLLICIFLLPAPWWWIAWVLGMLVVFIDATNR